MLEIITKKKKEEFLKNIKGLNNEEVINSREKNGINKLSETKKQILILKILSIFKEPMFFLLIVAASIYFIVGEYSDGIIMLIFVFGICLIEYIQEAKTGGRLLYSQSFGVNESVLTGESEIFIKI